MIGAAVADMSLGIVAVHWMPIFAPVVIALGYSPISMNMQISYLTPPRSGLALDLVLFFPEVALWLPEVLRK